MQGDSQLHASSSQYVYEKVSIITYLFYITIKVFRNICHPHVQTSNPWTLCERTCKIWCTSKK